LPRRRPGCGRMAASSHRVRTKATLTHIHRDASCQVRTGERVSLCGSPALSRPAQRRARRAGSGRLGGELQVAETVRAGHSVWSNRRDMSNRPSWPSFRHYSSLIASPRRMRPPRTTEAYTPTFTP
jgi:hypothetical protein